MMAVKPDIPANNPLADSKKILLLRLEHDQEIARGISDLRIVRPGSVLEQDDQVLGGYALSTLVLDLLATAAHVSSSLQKLVFGETEEEPLVSAPLHGPYSLVRTHLEATSQALWLMAPQSGRARIRRCIRYWCAEVKLLNSFQSEWSRSFPTPQRIGLEDLRVIATGAGLDLEGFPGRQTWTPMSSGDVLKSVEFAHNNPTLTWFNTWQLCSGFAHSKQWAAKIFTEQPTPDSGDFVPQAKARTSLPVLASVVHEAGLLLDEAARRFGQLSTTSDASWDWPNVAGAAGTFK